MGDGSRISLVQKRLQKVGKKKIGLIGALAAVISILLVTNYELFRATMMMIALCGWPLIAGYQEGKKHGSIHGTWTTVASGVGNCIIMFIFIIAMPSDLGVWLWILFSTFLLFGTIYVQYKQMASGRLITAPPQSQVEQLYCPSCGKLATYIPQYQRHYCYACKKYVAIPPPPPPPI